MHQRYNQDSYLKHIHGISEKSTKASNVKQTNIFEKRETVEEVVSKLCIDGIAFRTIANSEILQKLGKNYQFAPDTKKGKPSSLYVYLHSTSNTFIIIKLKYC